MHLRAEWFMMSKWCVLVLTHQPLFLSDFHSLLLAKIFKSEADLHLLYKYPRFACQEVKNNAIWQAMHAPQTAVCTIQALEYCRSSPGYSIFAIEHGAILLLGIRPSNLPNCHSVKSTTLHQAALK